MLALFAVLCQVFFAASNVNLTPVPKSMTVGEGELVLPQSFTILVVGPDSIAAEAERFAEHMNEVAGMNVLLGDAMVNTPSLFVVDYLTGSEALAPEGYTLKVTSTGVTIGATTATGCYYAFQTIKKLLPPHVMAGVPDAKVTSYALPVVDIADEPRFAYRGFMLDVSRHFFELDELKRMIDVMAYYKMNRFHWHLTDDQGWRIEIKKYPKLTSVGAVRSDSYMCDFKYGGYYTKETYGPYFYTQDEARELVAYARERHIEIVPEVEFPGHACAAVAAYPEFSCWPNGSHSVQVNGGIFSDVLNVANPGAVRFAKDVLDEIVDIFPYEQIHIGGDECPTSAWSGNAECQALMQEKGFSHIRELQSHFVRQLSDHLTSKEGDERRTVIMWNESLSAAGTNVEMIEGTGGMMMCWEPNNTYPTALKAAKMGMKSIITPQIPYYINRKHCNDPGEPQVAGHGGDNLQAVYNHLPIPNDVPAELHPYYHGIQGTFWTEHVGDNMLLEYLALPRLIAIAESAWSPQAKKNFDDFCRRVAADTVLLNYNKYTYARYYLEPEADEDAMVLPTLSTDDAKAWYRIVTANTGDANRTGKCIELVRAGSPIIGTGNAQVNRLWSATVAEEGSAAYDYQLWALMEDPNEPGSYALVNKAYPNGSVKPTPTASNNTARWDYDTQNRHYGFILGDKVYGQNGDYYQYSIRSKQSASGMYMNMAAGGQQYSINLWNNPSDGNSGIWIFKPIAIAEEPAEVAYPVAGACYQLVNTVDRFASWTLADEGTAHLMARRADYAADVWEIVSSEVTSAGQQLTLRNVATGRYMQGNSHPLTLGNQPTTYTNIYNDTEGDFTLSVNGSALFPMPERATSMPHTVNAGGIRPQGAAWQFVPSFLITYRCYDEEGVLIGTYHQAAEAGAAYALTAPEIPHYAMVNYKDEAADIKAVNAHATIDVVYRRESYAITLRLEEQSGALIDVVEYAVPVGEEFAIAPIEIPYFTFVKGNQEGYEPTADATYTLTYSTDAYLGFKAVGELCTQLKAGNTYLIYNAKNETSRSGFLSVGGIGENITTTNGLQQGNMTYVWQLKASGSGYKVANGLEGYIPVINKGGKVAADDTGDTFTFTLNGDNTTFSVKGTNGLYWNGNADNTFTGWTDGHPFKFYNYTVEPYYCLTIECVDEAGVVLQTIERYIKAGDSYVLIDPVIKGYYFKTIEGDIDVLNNVNRHVTLRLVYTDKEDTGIQRPIKDMEGKVYRLNGVLVEKPAENDIYIFNGKKIIKQ